MPEVNITRQMEDTKAKALSVFETAKKILVKDQDSYDYQVSVLRSIKTQAAEIEKERKDLVTPFQRGVKRLNEFFGYGATANSGPLLSLKRAETLIKAALVKYTNEQEAERKREEREAQAKADKQKEKLEKKADKQEEKGQEEKAEETRLEAQSVPVPIVPPKVEKAKGVSFKEIWKFKIIDVKKIPRQYLVVDEKTLGNIARSTKGKVNIPGVEFYPEKSVAGSRY
ncbi:MAG: hypothetical protein D8M57_13070 [Candidatus Scalindua sp. AMX11]|nr:MAG: hypothetical protein DWQ00_12020 [Candidatus Scalindua sp.]NOG83796.1 hypothetical protein [Planctomycetota bacterium]RZV82952.1 MAG: hypothetical protein EX341_09175 [Candidatus Scalindua sp. SCAELEC01]TDE64426.1 MAG: hypothetical protein D8M57_13070 [Candidatus Scalindua sp. AMX11]GJQ59753.1 MAG: hypothetical protein SCALA701_25540 [Candidatus Scalindua sp.]